jgi:hypothetical protein
MPGPLGVILRPPRRCGKRNSIVIGSLTGKMAGHLSLQRGNSQGSRRQGAPLSRRRICVWHSAADNLLVLPLIIGLCIAVLISTYYYAKNDQMKRNYKMKVYNFALFLTIPLLLLIMQLLIFNLNERVLRKDRQEDSSKSGVVVRFAQMVMEPQR